MKNLAGYFLLFFFLFFSPGLFCQFDLEIRGTVTHRDTEKPIKGVKVELIDRSSILQQTVFTNDTGMYAIDISLKKPNIYLVKISYPGFVTKTFEISTENIPKEALETQFPIIQPDLALFESIKGVDYSVIDKPLNRYYYDAEKDNYFYDEQLIASTLIKLENLKTAEQNFNKENEILILKEQAIMHQKAVLRQRRLLLSLLIGLPVLVLVLFFIFRFVRKNKGKNNLKN